jgi:hypothetical protein
MFMMMMMMMMMTRYCRQILKELGFSRQILEKKFSEVEFH